MKRPIIKIISLVLVFAFTVNSTCYGLATLPASQNPIVKREILAALDRTQIRYADSEDARRLLKANNASCLLLSSGKYLVTKEVAENDLKLLRAIIHEDIEAIMQIIAKEDRYKYQGIKELILKYFLPSKDNKLPIDLYVNHTVAIAFEWLSLLENRIIIKGEISPEDVAFINAAKPIIMANKHSHFTAEFWDSKTRGDRIKKAFNNGMVFYKVANTSAPTNSPQDKYSKPSLADNDPMMLFLKGKGMSVERIHPLAYKTIKNESAAFKTDNIEWVLRSIFGKVSGEEITNEEIKHFFSDGKIRTSVMIFSPKMRPGDMRHSDRLKKDVPIKAGNRPYSPVIGEALTHALANTIQERLNIAEIISRCKQEGRQLVVVGKYTGGLIPGMLIADRFNLPFVTLAKLPFNFKIPQDSGQVIRVKEPHLPADSEELYSYMLANPNTSVIIVDDESTTGIVHTNTVKELEKMGIKTEAVVVLMQSSDEAKEKMLKESGVPYIYMNAMYTNNNWRLKRPVYLPFSDSRVVPDEPLLYPKKEDRNGEEIQFNMYHKENDAVFVDHSLRGMTMYLEPSFLAYMGEKIGKFLTQTMHIQDARKKYYEKGKTLYIVGATPSGLYAGLGASQITRIPLLGATNRPEPVGYEDTVNYVGLDGHNYSIYGLKSGDGVILITGELTDGEEQARIIKSLRDKGVDVMCSVSAVENEYYFGRNKVGSLGIPVHSLKTYKANEGIYQTNISSKVRASFIYAVEELNRTVRGMNSEAEVVEILGFPSSFTRSLMIEGSDMDEVYIYVKGVSQTQLNGLNNKFISWLNRSDMTLFDDNAKPPILISTESREAMDKTYETDEMPLITIYDNGEFKSERKLAELSNRSRGMLHPKQVARIKFLLALGELDPDHVRCLLAAEGEKNNIYYKELERILESPDKIELSQGAKKLVKELDHLYREGAWVYAIADDKEKDFENTLFELCEIGLVKIIDNKMILMWRLHTARWSDRFWTRRFEVKCSSSKDDIKAQEIIKRITSRLTKVFTGYAESEFPKLVLSQDSVLAEQAIRYIRTLQSIPDVTQDAILKALRGATFIDAAAIDVIVDHRSLFESKVKESIQEIIKSGDLMGYFNRKQKNLNHLINILFKWAIREPGTADDITRFIYDNIVKDNEIICKTVPPMISQCVIENLGEVYKHLNDQMLKKNVHAFVLRSSFTYIYRTRVKARGALKKIESQMPNTESMIKDAAVNKNEAATAKELEDRRMLYDAIEKKRKSGDPVSCIVSDFDDCLLRSFTRGARCLDPAMSFWLNWLTRHNVSVAIVTGSGYERIYDRCFSERVKLPLEKNGNLHLFTDTGAYYNDRPVSYQDIPDEVWRHVDETLSPEGWMELKDGRLPRKIFINTNTDQGNATAIAKKLKVYLASKRYNYDIVVSRWSGTENCWTIKVFAINKVSNISKIPGIKASADRILALFDDAGEFGIDKPFMDFAKNGIRVNVGYELEQEEGLLQLKTKNEDGSRLAIEALAASIITEIMLKDKNFQWNELVDELKGTGAFSADDIEKILSPIRELVDDGLSSIESEEEEVLKKLLVKSENVLQATPVHLIELHPTNRCNLNCDNCIAGNRDKTTTLPFKDLDYVGMLNPSEVLIIGGGEPTIYKDGAKNFNDFVLRLRELVPKTSLSLGTNGTFIPAGRWQEEISWISISLHGSSRESFKARTGKDEFDLVWNNIFDEYLLNSPVKDIRVSFVYTKDNFYEIFPLVEKIWQRWKQADEELRRKGILKKFSFVLQAEAEDKGPHDPFEILDLTGDMKRYWDQELARIETEKPELWDFIKEHAKPLLTKPFQKQIAKPAEICWIVSNYLLIGANGMIYPCCVMPASAPQANLGKVGQPLETLLKKRISFMNNPPMRCKKGCHICRSYTGNTVKQLLLQVAESENFRNTEDVTSAAKAESASMDRSLDIIEIYPTDLCMLGCRGCTNIERRHTGHQINALPIETIDKLKEFRPKQIRIVGGGEPTLYKYKEYTFNDLIARIRTNLPEARLGMSTNGVYIPTGDWQKQLAWIGISLYGASREDFLKYTGEDKFDIVMNNIFDGYYSNSPISDIRVTFFYSRENIKLLPSLIKQLWERWNDTVQKDKDLPQKKRFLINLSPYVDDRRPEDPFASSNLTDEEMKEYGKRLRDLESDQPELWNFIKTYAPSVISRPFEKHVSPSAQRCPMASRLAVLAANQHLYPCFFMANTSHDHDFGSINDLSPERLLEIRRQHYMNPPERCKQSCHPGATYTGKLVKKSDGSVSFGYAEGVGVINSAVSHIGQTDSRRIAMTGATGDIGVGLSRLLLNKGCSVTALMRSDPLQEMQSALMMDSKNFSYKKGDIFLKKAIEEILNKGDVVYHLAAIVGQDINPEMQASVLSVNAFGTALLAWLASKSKSPPTIVYASSQRCYGIENDPRVVEWMKKALDKFRGARDKIFSLPDGDIENAITALSERILKEDPLPEGVAIYDISKLMGEELLKELPNVVIARIANVYGPECHSGRLMQRLIENRFSDGSKREEDENRDYVYADDVSKILYELCKEQDAGFRYLDTKPKVVDIASGKKISTENVWEIIKKFTPDQKGRLEIVASSKKSADQDGHHAEQLLGRSFCGIETGIRNIIDEYRYKQKPRTTGESGTIVFDIGGTSIRTGIFYPDGVLEIISKDEAPNYNIYQGASVEDLQQKLIDYIKGKIEEARKIAGSDNSEITLDRVAISFPGPVIDYSTIDRAPTLWGTNTKSINLSSMLKRNMPGLKDVRVMHDISADAVRYAVEKKKDKFCVVTISSGISCRIYDKEKGGLITDEFDLAGEIGHLKIDYSKDAPLCECGERGHLNAFASGRAAERIMREKAAHDPDGFRQSLLYEYTNGDASKFDNAMFADAIAERDEWAIEILKELARPVAYAINQISAVSGIRDFYLVGGFAIAHGDVYLNDILENLREIRLLNRAKDYFEGHIELGYSDDADGMRGAGYFAQYNKIGIDNAPGNIFSKGHVKKFVDSKGGTCVEALAPTELSYKNYFTKGVFEDSNPILAQLCNGRKTLMVIDEAVYVRWKAAIDRYIWANKLDCTILSLPGGEAAKDIDYTEAICTRASDLGLDRKGIIITVGGGAIMDVAGLAAQLYRRGVDYIRIPTTLLGMIDAAVGVKVGINYKGSKNFLGAFYPPKYVISDTEFLATVPEREMRSGAAEIIKVALISNPRLFEVLEKHAGGLVRNIKFEGYDQFIEDAAIELLKHLQMDFYEHDLMRHVDFGHTMAHYFESVSNYEMTHGEAVAIDILISAYIARERGILSSEDFDRIVALHKKLGLPFYHPAISIETMWSGVQKAISHKGGHLMMVVPKKIGQTAFIDSLSKEELAGALEFLKFLDKEKIEDGAEKMQGVKSSPAGKAAINIPFEKIRSCLIKSKDQFPEGVIDAVVNILEKESQGIVSISDIKQKYPDKSEDARKRIVFTGSVYGGKTTFLRRSATEYSKDTVYLPEIVPSLIDGGIKINPDSYIEQINVQRLIFILKYLLEVETSSLHPDKVVLCERGTLDGMAWWPGKTADFEEEFGGVKAELERYGHVIFVESVASTAHAQHELKKRYENVKLAQAVDLFLKKMYVVHNSFYEIPHTDWGRKTVELKATLASLHKNIIDEMMPATSDIYDTQSVSILLFDLLHAKFQEDRTYIIKYDEARLSESQIAIIKQYVESLRQRIGIEKASAKIRIQKCSSANGSKESLISVYCIGKDFKGEGHVDVSISEGEMKDYLLRITGMINIALASSNIPDNLSKEDVDKYRPLLSYISNQYKSILGEGLAIPDSPEDILKVIRRIVLGLPKSNRMEIEKIEEYNKLAKEALTAA